MISNEHYQGLRIPRKELVRSRTFQGHTIQRAGVEKAPVSSKYGINVMGETLRYRFSGKRRTVLRKLMSGLGVDLVHLEQLFNWQVGFAHKPHRVSTTVLSLTYM